jgi:prepilin-type N-terminal cleavage/methylation domain-containing protein
VIARHHHRHRHAASGFTLVELMVAVALSGVVIGFVFQIHNQMVGALRGQANLSEVVETVTAAREMIAREVRLAAMGFPAGGVQFGGGDPTNDRWRGIDGTNDADGGGADVVDQIAIQRTEGDLLDADVTTDADPNYWFFPVVGADTLGFTTTEPTMVATDAGNAGCAATAGVVDATGIKVLKTAFDPGGVCSSVSIADGNTMRLARIRRIAFRLDPARFELGVLQRAINGGAWEDIGIGFSNFQVAVRYFEAGDGADVDGDGDPLIDWYSGDAMEPFNGRPDFGSPMQVGISIEGRNLRRLDNLASISTPAYTDIAFPENNPLGNFGQACPSAQYDPCGVADLSLATQPRYLFPEHVYRSSSTTIWLRSRLESL